MSKNVLIIILSSVAVVLIATAVLLWLFLPEEYRPVGSFSSYPDQTSSTPQSDSSQDLTVPLEVTYPTDNITVFTESITVTGSGDTAIPLYINGEEVEMGEDGSFSHTISLVMGENVITVTQNTEKRYTVVRKKKVITEVMPTDSLTLDGNSKLTVKVRALTGSSVSARLNGTTVTLSEQSGSSDGEYSYFLATLTMPVNYYRNVDLGKIVFEATSSEGKETVNGSSVTIRRTITYDDKGYVMPSGADYKNVGKTNVAEVICRSAETLSVSDSKDISRPTNNYLPKGTVDYCSDEIELGSNKVRTLRYGKRLYMRTNNTGENLKVYKGSLPDTNSVGIADFSSEGRHSVLTLDVDWKAPFLFDLLPQSYNGNTDFTISSATYSYIDITFCYAAQFTGEIDLSTNRIFSSYEIIENEVDYTLRLYLKNKGKFYGWSAEYNNEGQLVFSFLNPVILNRTDNQYGYSLEGAVILIDAGHGGADPGAVSPSYGPKTEAALNLTLATKLKTKLESFGATVYMTRTDNSTVSVLERMNKVRDIKPDFVLAIHRNSNGATYPRGFNSYHFNAFSAAAAKYIYETTEQKALYNTTRWSGVKSHYFYLCRNTHCPVVLTENGFISNYEEYNQMIDDGFNDKCADAFVDGIFAYFKSIQ